MRTDLIILMPEITLLVMTCVVLLVDAFSEDKFRKITYWITQLSLLLTLWMVFYYSPDYSYLAFNGAFITDTMSVILKIVICGISIIVFFYSYEYLKESELLKGEYFVLGLFAVLGMMIMSSAYHLLSVYLGIELLSLSLYAMVAMHRKSKYSTEAAIKYFVLGALASGMLLYGISMIYGVTGSLQLTNIADAINNSAIEKIYLVYGMIFIIVGIAFKLGAAPFHMWLPDVYQGAPTSVTLFISSAPKIAAFAITVRVLVDGLFPLIDDWQSILSLLAILSMAIGNIIAIAQENIKRMLAYSTIAHVGYLFLGLIAGTPSGFAGSMFYVISYSLMTIGAFGMIILLGRFDLEAEKIEDFKGLIVRNSWFALIMLFLMFSMAGVPPFLGFWSKWFVIKELVDSGFFVLAVAAVFFSIIGAYYYLRIVKIMCFDKPDTMRAIKASQQMRTVLTINGLLILIIGLSPNTLMNLCLSAF